MIVLLDLLISISLAIAVGGVLTYITGKSSREVHIETDGKNKYAPPKATSNLAAVIASIHPFKVDIRIAFIVGFVIFGLVYHLYLFIPFAIIDGFLIGEAFLEPKVAEMLNELEDLATFLTALRTTISSSTVSVATAVTSALGKLPQTSEYRSIRAELYPALLSPDTASQGDNQDEAVSSRSLALQQLLLSSTIPDVRLTDVLVYFLITQTDWKLSDQLEATSSEILSNLNILRELLHSELLPVLRQTRLAVVLALFIMFFSVIAFGGGSLSNYGAESAIASVAIGVTLFIQAYLVLKLYLPIPFRTRYF